MDLAIEKGINLYLSGASSRAAAAEVGVSKDKLLYWMKKLGINRRTKSEATENKLGTAPWRDKKTLEHYYIKLNRSSIEIAEEFGCNKSTILDWLNRFGIPTRNLSESHIGKEPSNKGTGKRNSDEMVTCACGCGELTYRYGSNSNERSFIYGHRLKGEANPLYKADSVNRTPRHNRSDYRLWRKAVLKACDYTCQRCGIVGGKLHSHHIKPMAQFPESAYDVNNGQALCADCHKQVHKEMRKELNNEHS